MSKNNEIYSYHTFMFPFTIEDSKFNFEEIENHLKQNWQEKDFEISGVQTNGNRMPIENYNEFIYFYPMVQSLLYNTEPDKVRQKLSKYFETNNKFQEYQIYMKEEEKKVSDYLILIENENLTFLHKTEKNKIKAKNIYLVDDKYYICEKECLKSLNENFTVNSIIPKCKYKMILNDLNKHNSFYIKRDDYSLTISGIALRIFKTGVGILSFHLENFEYNNLSDILKINDFGRRIYPQFKPINDTKSNFLADKLILKSSNENITEIQETFQKDKEKYISNTIMELLGKKFTFENEKNKIPIRPLIDDRMFTLCWYGNNDFSRNLKNYISWTEEYHYLSNEDWSKFLFIDGNYNSLQSKNMMKEYLKKHTYNRWVNDGTLFGISRYSFVLATNEEWFSKNILLTHMKTMYYQIMVIALMQRASILNFKHRITEIVSGGEIKYSEIKNIQKDYLKFINSMCFKEITAQEQGIELYNMAKDIMGIDEALKELDNEISELNNFYMLEESEKSTKNSENLALIAGVIIVPTLIVTLASNSSINVSWLKGKGLIGWGMIVPIIVTTLILKLWFKNSSNDKLWQDKVLVLIIFLLIFLGIA